MEREAQDELNRLIEETLINDPNLKIALDTFQMGQREYTRALQGKQIVKFVASDSTTLPGDQYAGIY